MNIFRNLIKNKKGAAMVYMIVAASIILALGVTTVVSAYAQLRTTQIQQNSDNNFYNADGVINAIITGLEEDISTATSLAYTKVITKYRTYSSPTAAKEDFDSYFLQELNSTLNDGDFSYDFTYNLSHILKMVQKAYPDVVGYTVTAVNGENYLDIETSQAFLRNLHVTYEDDNGYYDEITTDVIVSVPNVEFTSIIGYLSAPFVVDDGMYVGTNTYPGVGLSIVGDTYINANGTSDNVITVDNGSSLEILPETEAVLTGNVKLQTASKLNIGDNTTLSGTDLWAENFDVGKSSVLSLICDCYVLDDIEVNGSYAKVQLAENYYGYSDASNHTDASTSSSISINAGHSTLDFSNLQTLLLGGVSYINTKQLDLAGSVWEGEKENTDQILTGESIGIKSTQAAYLVDDSLFSFIPSNPLSYSEYQSLISIVNWEDVVLNTKTSTGKTYAEHGATIRPVFFPYESGQVYLYLSFEDLEDASSYYRQLYAADSLLAQKLRYWASEYISSITIGSDTNIMVNGNYLPLLSYTEKSVKEDGLGYTEPEVIKKTENVQEVIDNASLTYLGASGNGSDGKKTEVTFAKIINKAKLTEMIEKATALAYADKITNDEVTIIDNGIVLKGTSSTTAVIVDNYGDNAYVVSGGQGIVIASGDIEIAGDFTGTIICGGKCTCTGGTPSTKLTVTIDKNVIADAMTLYFYTSTGKDKGTLGVLNCFNGYEDSEVTSATQEKVLSASDIRNCISFTNWDRD